MQHYSFREQLSPDSTFACIVMPGYLMPVLEFLLSGMSYFKRFTKGAAPLDQSTRSGSSQNELYGHMSPPELACLCLH